MLIKTVIIVILGSKRIKRLTSQLDDLTKKVTSAATRIRNNPHDTGAGQHLNELRKEWQTKVKELTAAIDEIINVTDFTAATGKILLKCCCIKKFIASF